MATNSKLLELEAKLFRGFGDLSRLSILELLTKEPLTVSEIVKKLKLSQSNVSMHLSCLYGCGLVKKKKSGKTVSYKLSCNQVKKTIEAARKIISHHSEEMFECTRY
ncbi:metalloregulator ArsR/SmtB family transcription factor [Patescibacteria group bacterium]|nr:metalloregulator ArsR/SmtB family transcription factor [Patescibacteria group bacterium]